MLVGIVGAGLAGLAAAVSLAEAGVDVLVLEAGPEPGGTTALSSGWIWRYRDLETFAWGAPHGDRALQRLLWDELPDALVWLERHGARWLASGTDNPHTEGVRIDGRQAVDALLRRLPKDAVHCDERVVAASHVEGRVLLQSRREGVVGEAPVRTREVDAVVFASGGYGADLKRIASECGVGADVARHWALRNAGLSDGTGMDSAMQLGAMRVPVTGECYARAMPVGVQLWPDDYVRFSQVYGEHAWVVDAAGDLVERDEHDWADTTLTWAVARRTGAGWYLLGREALARRTPYGTVARSVQEARSAGALVLEASAGELPAALEEHGTRLRGRALAHGEQAVCAVGVRPGITHTMAGLRCDTHARALQPGTGRGRDPQPLGDVLVAGVEAGGFASGGYASGLAQALVLGRVAARTLAGS